MFDFLQKSIICLAQTLIEWFKVSCFYVALGFLFRLSLAVIVFESIKNNLLELTLSIIYGLFFDITSSYAIAVPLVIYRVLVPTNFDHDSKLGKIAYLTVSFLTLLAITAHYGLDLMIFENSNTRAGTYVPEMGYYYQTAVDLLASPKISHSLKMSAIGVFAITILLTTLWCRLFANIKFTKSPTFSMKLAFACTLMLLSHLGYTKLLATKPKQKTNNRYILAISDNLAQDLLSSLVIKHKTQKSMPTTARSFVNLDKVQKNVVIFLVEGLSEGTMGGVQNLDKIINKSMRFNNAFSTSKLPPSEINSIAGGNPFFHNKCDIPFGHGHVALFFSSLPEAQSKYFYSIFKNCGFKQSSESLKKRAKRSEKAFIFLSMLNIKNAEKEIYDFITSSTEKSWFRNTFFIIAGYSNPSHSQKSLDQESYKTTVAIYAPYLIKQSVSKEIISTIDILPSVADLAGISYNTKNSLADTFYSNSPRRAFIIEDQDFLYITPYGSEHKTIKKLN